MSDDLMAGLREDIAKRHARIQEAADPDCRYCHGSGFTHGYIGPGKIADYPCRCTKIPECE